MIQQPRIYAGRRSSTLARQKTARSGHLTNSRNVRTRSTITTLVSVIVMLAAVGFADANSPNVAAINRVLPKVVKIYGAGGLRGLEAYQTGLLISPEGHVLTVWSYVLDTEFPIVILDDGRRFESTLVGADPHLEIAILKVESEEKLPSFDLSKIAIGQAGQRIFAFSNLFGVATGDEPVSVQRGVVAAVTELSARRGVFKTPYSGPVYVTDALTNNPGAAGGALTSLRGELLGLVGKDLRNAEDNTWLNYSLPIAQLQQAIDDIKAGKTRPRHDPLALLPRKPIDLAALGIVLVPDVVDNTPPFIDAVRSGSPAETAGLRGDDLILFVNNILIQSLDQLDFECRRIDGKDALQITVRRDDQLKVIQLNRQGATESNP